MKDEKTLVDQPSTSSPAPADLPSLSGGTASAHAPSEYRAADVRQKIELELVPITDRHQWQLAAWLMADAYEEEGDPWGAVEVFRYVTSERKDELRNFLHLADALVLAGDLDEALEAAATVLESEPSCVETQRLVIDILRNQGKDWRSYEWRQMPQVIELGPELADRCYDWLRRNGAADFCQFEFEMLEGLIPLFDDEELALLLAGDPRIERIDDGSFPCWALKQV